MSETAFVLIVAASETQWEAFADELRQQGHACRIVPSLNEAMESIYTRQPDVILLDTQLSDPASYMKLLQQAGQVAPDVEFVLLQGTAEDGALLPLSEARRIHSRLPFDVPHPRLMQAVNEAAILAQKNHQKRAFEQQVQRRFEFDGIVTADAHMIRLIHTLQRIADSKLTVLILGESGTGKELFARAVHQHSPRKHKAYRAINCAGLNENLLESELFGHIKGSFTGAVADRKGLFEIVDGGTLFLDELGDMPMSMQAKLLRVLENGEIMPVGANEIRQVDVRVVAATRRDLRDMVDKGDFRDDLFYRLNQATLRIPPLRERREDIPLLVDHFLHEAAQEHQKEVTDIAPEAVRKLAALRWPGNARELRSVVEQMVVLADHPVLTVQNLPEEIRGSTDLAVPAIPSTAGLTMEQMEHLHIANTLKLTGGNREKTAKMLGIGARTLYRKLRDYNL